MVGKGLHVKSRSLSLVINNSTRYFYGATTGYLQ
jgi:hypothetical protein